MQSVAAFGDKTGGLCPFRECNNLAGRIYGAIGSIEESALKACSSSNGTDITRSSGFAAYGYQEKGKAVQIVVLRLPWASRHLRLKESLKIGIVH